MSQIPAPAPSAPAPAKQTPEPGQSLRTAVEMSSIVHDDKAEAASDTGKAGGSLGVQTNTLAPPPPDALVLPPPGPTGSVTAVHVAPSTTNQNAGAGAGAGAPSALPAAAERVVALPAAVGMEHEEAIAEASATKPLNAIASVGEKNLPPPKEAVAVGSTSWSLATKDCFTAKRKLDHVEVAVVDTPIPAAKRASTAPTGAPTGTTAGTTGATTTSSTNIVASDRSIGPATNPNHTPFPPIQNRPFNQPYQIPPHLAKLPRRETPRRYSQNQCGLCDYCMVDDCGVCKSCLDMPRFGGPNTKRSRCKSRQACPYRLNKGPTNPGPAKPRRTLPTELPPLPAGAPPMTMRTKCRQPTADACGRCLNCFVDDCGKCPYCLDNPRFGGIWKLQKKCRYRRKCLRKDVDTTAITSERSSSAKYLLQGVSPDNFTMSEILSFPVVFSHHVPTASRTASIVPIAPVLPFALESADTSPAAGPTDLSTNDSSGDPKNDEGLNAPSDVADPTRTDDVEKDADPVDDGEKHGGSATSDTVGIDVACSEGKSNVAGNEGEGLKVPENNSIDAAMGKESEENDLVYVDTASTPDHGDAGGAEALAPPQIGAEASEPKGPFVTEEEAEASQKEAESQQKQWDKLMKSSVARFERRRAGGKNYSRVPSSRPPSTSNESDGSDGDRATEGGRRSRRKRRPRSRRGGDDDEDDSSISEAEPEKRKERHSTPKEITSGPATDLPSGWITEKIRRGSDHSRIDHFWYSPVLEKKFRSRLDVERFLAKMEIARDRLGIFSPKGTPAESGDEAEASEASETSEASSPTKEPESTATKESTGNTTSAISEEDLCEASEAIPPTKEPEGTATKESNTTSAINEEDQAKVEELAWTLLQEDGRRRR